MPETPPANETVDRRRLNEIPTGELISILGKKLPHHPMHLADDAALQQQVAEIAPPPDTPEPAPFHRVESVIAELRQRMMRIAQEAGFEDNGITTDVLLQWECDLYQAVQNLTVLGGKHVISIMELYANMKEAKARMGLMKSLVSAGLIQRKDDRQTPPTR